MRFAVRWPGSPVASPRSHGVPRRDVSGRVHVSVTDIPAGHAGEEGLALAALRCDAPTCAATLRCERWTDSLYSAWCFVFQPTHEQAPARTQDFSIQTRFLTDIPARIIRSSSRGPGHATNTQILNADHVETSSQIGGCLLHPIFAGISVMNFEPSYSHLYLASAVRAFPGACQLALQSPKPGHSSRAQRWHRKHLASGQRRAHGHTPVEAHHLSGARSRDRIGHRGEGYVPAACRVGGDPVGLRGRNSTRPAEPHPPRFRDPHLPGATADPTYVARLHCDNAETLITVGLAPTRPTVSTSEEVTHRLVEVPQRLLLHHLATAPQPAILLAGLGELNCLFVVARRTCSPGPPPRLLLDGQVPYKAGMRAVAAKDLHLIQCGREAIARHWNTISSSTDIFVEVKRRPPVYWPGLTPRL